MKTTQQQKRASADPLSGVSNTGKPQSLRAVRLAVLDESDRHEICIPLLLADGWEQSLYRALHKVGEEYSSNYLSEFIEPVEESDS